MHRPGHAQGDGVDGHGQRRDQGGQDGGAVVQHGAAAAQGVEEGSGEDAAQAVANGEHAHQGGGQAALAPTERERSFAKDNGVAMAARKMMHRKARQKVKRRSIWPVV